MYISLLLLFFVLPTLAQNPDTVTVDRNTTVPNVIHIRPSPRAFPDSTFVYFVNKADTTMYLVPDSASAIKWAHIFKGAIEIKKDHSRRNPFRQRVWHFQGEQFPDTLYCIPSANPHHKTKMAQDNPSMIVVQSPPTQGKK